VNGKLYMVPQEMIQNIQATVAFAATCAKVWPA
jgi:hypothetical protein